MNETAPIEGLLREAAPRVLRALVRRYGNFTDAEDAAQEALVVAASRWPAEGVPADPTAWLVRVASRRLSDQFRRDDARRRRELLAASWSILPHATASGHDDTLRLMFMCCHPALTPSSAIPLTLRAVGGLTTREIAAAFVVPEPTMAQRISRAKATLKAVGASFSLPSADEFPERLRLVLHVLYLLFNEGYAASDGPDLARTDLSGEAIRLTRSLHTSLSHDPHVRSLLALMLLTDARRPARTGADGELIPLADQDRTLWDRRLIAEGTALIDGTSAGRAEGPAAFVDEYQVQAAIAAAHDCSPSHDETDWRTIESLYARLEAMTDNPMVTLNRAVAVAMAHGPQNGLLILDGLELTLAGHHRFHAVRAHLLERAGDRESAVAEYRSAAARTTSEPEQRYLLSRAARLADEFSEREEA